MPAETPKTIPVDEPMPATEGAPLDQTPKAELLSVAVVPAHTEVGPVIAGGCGSTVTDMLVRQLPPSE